MAITAYEHAVLTPISDIRIGPSIVNVYGSALSPVFKTADIATALGIKDQAQMIRDLDPDDKGMLRTDTAGGVQKVSFISEFGLYDVLFASRKTIAKEFKKTVKASLYILRVTGKVTKDDLKHLEGSTPSRLPAARGGCNIQPPLQGVLYNAQPPTVRQIRAEFEYVRQSKKLLDLSAADVKVMTDTIAVKYGLSPCPAKTQ